MQDTSHIVRKLGLEASKVASVQGKAAEYVRLATARLGSGGLGQVGALAAAAACENSQRHLMLRCAGSAQAA